MHLALAFWGLAAAVLTTCEAALRRLSKQPLSDTVDAALRARSEVAKFGPDNCISTWRNEDGHCELETRCKEHDISKYAVKFICIDDGGEKVRHVFAVGSFDPEEQFDTLIECKKCLAEKEETIQIIYDSPPTKKGEKPSKIKKASLKKTEEEEEEELGGSPLKALRNEVKELEGFMMNTSAELQKLNTEVYSDGYKPPGSPKPVAVQKAEDEKDLKEAGKKAAGKAVKGEKGEKAKAEKPEKAKAASSLVHHETAHHQETPLRIDAEAARVKKEHRRHLAEENGDVEEAPRIPEKENKVFEAVVRQLKLEDAPSSLAGAVTAAEVRDEDGGTEEERPTFLKMQQDEDEDDNHPEEEEATDGDEDASE
jgi:hypothetical protein